jgi:hypothetical protein
MPGKKKPGPSVRDPKVYKEIREQGGSKEKAARSAKQRRHAAGPRLERREASPARMRTGHSMTCASVPRSWAYRSTPARTNPNWCPC